MLHEFVYYDKHSGRITGRFRTSTPDLLPKPPSPDLDQVRVTDEEHLKLLSDPNSTRALLSGRVRDGKIANLSVSPRYHGRLELVTDLKDRDGDGVPESPADGSSTVRVTVRVVDREGAVHRQKGTRVTFRVTHGSLSTRAVDADKGTAYVDWKGPADTVQARIAAQADGCEPASLTVEFIPPDEHRALSSAKK